jgi:hypothetical protein
MESRKGYDSMKNRLDGVRLDACAAALDDISRRLDSQERFRHDSGPEWHITFRNSEGQESRETISANTPKDAERKGRDMAKQADPGGKWKIIQVSPANSEARSQRTAEERAKNVSWRDDAHERSRRDTDERKFQTAQNVWNDIIKDTIELRDYAISQGNTDKADIYQKILDKELKKAGPYYRYSGPGSTARRDTETRADPPVSEKQRRAMRAAASGNSTLDIPKDVGEEFSEADPSGRLPESKRDATFGSRVAGKGGGVDMSARGSTTAYRGYLIKNVGNNNYTISRDGSHISYASSVENAKSQINELA